MKVISINDNHIIRPEPDKEYGCICNKCGTVFTFQRSEASVPRCISPKPEYCTIMCPNCKNIITLDRCKEFKDTAEKIYFEKHYGE